MRDRIIIVFADEATEDLEPWLAEMTSAPRVHVDTTARPFGMPPDVETTFEDNRRK